MTTNYAAYYEALELSPGAPPEEVKRAYFRLLRQYSPETHPEEFKRIRQAYDVLKDRTPEMEEPAFPAPQAPMLQAPLQTALRNSQSGDHEAAAAVLAEMLHYVPDDPYVLLMLSVSQLLAGHPQKAAKTALHLTELHPESRDAWRIAALGTYSRGWYKKALPLFRKAYSLGEKRLDFLTDYAAAARDNGEREESKTVSREVLQREKWTKDTAEYAVQAYGNLSELANEKEDALWMLNSYAEFLPLCRRLPPSIEELLYPVGALYFLREHYLSDPDLYREADRCLASVEKIRRDEEHSFLLLMRAKLLSSVVKNDSRFHDEAWYELASACSIGKGIFKNDTDDPEVREFAVLDTELCLLKEDPDAFREDAALVEREYPYLYEDARGFLDEVRNGDREALFSRLKRRFLKIYYKFEGSDFQKRYPEELPAIFHEVKVHDGFQPFVRAGKKIGRNDPCPCGSGKKFKKCCQGKGIYD